VSLDPVILFFVLGVLARLGRSELRLPEPLYETLSIYLLLAIGLKGGAQLALQPWHQFWPVAVLAMGLSAVTPVLLYPVLRRWVRVGAADAASIGAHYGSVSVVTFAVAQSALTRAGYASEPWLATLVALMEAPGIVVGVLLARRAALSTPASEASLIPAQTGWGALAHEVLLGKAVVLLLGGVLVGCLAGPGGLSAIEPVFVNLFKGVLALFLLEMGLVTGGRLHDLRRAGWRLIVFGLTVSPLLGTLGALCGSALGLSVAGVVTLATLAASASYIAAPTAMRIAVPQANPSLSIGLALGVSFPFNVVLGIPLYLTLARHLTGT
jgi:hypothetical protein